MRIDLPKEPCWDVPEGGHRLRLIQIQRLDRQFTGREFNEVRLCGRCSRWMMRESATGSQRSDQSTCDKGSELRHDLTNWLGDNLFSYVTPDGRLDMDKVIGLEADGWVALFHNERFPKPFVCVKTIMPVGTLSSNGDN